MDPHDTYQSLLPRIARESITARLNGERYRPPPLPADLDHPAGVFVTLWENDELRGCIGHIEPLYDHLVAEVADCAQLAAFRDPRFAPMRADEMDQVSIEVSVLTPTEPVDDLYGLDPHRWGVVVACGGRRGVLLPDVKGVETVEHQLAIALRKGGIEPEEPWTVRRFEVLKYEEGEPPSRGAP